MHPEIIDLIGGISRLLQQGTLPKPGENYVLSIKLPGDPACKMLAYHAYEVLRQHDILEGEERHFSAADFNKQGRLLLGSHAAFYPIPKDNAHVSFVLDFGRRTPAQAAEAVDGFLAAAASAQFRLSRYHEVVPAFKKLAEQTSIPPGPIKAIGNEVLITTRSNGFYGEGWDKFAEVLAKSRLLDPRDVRTFPLDHMVEPGVVTTRIPMVGRTPLEVKRSLNKYIQAKNWVERNVPIYIDGKGLRRQ